MAKSWFKKVIDGGEDLTRLGRIPSHHKFLKFGNVVDEDAGLPKVWYTNGHENIAWLDKNKDRVLGSVYDLPDYENRAIIICGMGESIMKQWKALKGIDRNRFVIVAVNSSAKFLLDRGIKPDYVVCIDGKPGFWTMDLGEKAKDVVALFSACAEPQAIKDWPGDMRIIPYGVKDKSLRRKIERRWGKGIICGGHSVNAALGAFVTQTKARIYIFIGNELSFKKHYYADGRESPHDNTGHFYATNLKGEKVKTLMPLYQYKVWTDSAMSELHPHYHFTDCSGGILGLDTNNKPEGYCDHKTLKQAIEDTIEAFRIAELPEREKKKAMYDILFASGYDPLNTKRQWKQMLEIFPFEKALDVGCGTAVGIKESRDKGYDVWGCDLADVSAWWKEQGIEEYCEIAPARDMPYADNSFDLILCSEVLEHIPEEEIAESFAEMYRVGSDKFVFTICLTEELWPAFGYITTHCTLKPPQWWLDKINEAGFNVYEAHTALSYNFKEMRGMFVYAVKDPGPYKRGEKLLAKKGWTKDKIVDNYDAKILVEPSREVYGREVP
jgi:SAM-dependent methyltransferase